MSEFSEGKGRKRICCAYIVKKGKRVYPKRAKCFVFWVETKRVR